MRWRTLSVVVLAILLIIIAAIVFGFGYTEPNFGHYMGDRLKTITAAEGQPASVSPGHYGGVTHAYAQQFGVCKTAIWERRGYTIYCSFEKQGNDWILIDTSTLPEGAVF